MAYCFCTDSTRTPTRTPDSDPDSDPRLGPESAPSLATRLLSRSLGTLVRREPEHSLHPDFLTQPTRKRMDTPPPKPAGECPPAPRAHRAGRTSSSTPTPTELAFDGCCGYVLNLNGELAQFNGEVGRVVGAHLEKHTKKVLLHLVFDGTDGSTARNMPPGRAPGPLELYLPCDRVVRLDKAHTAAFVEREQRVMKVVAAKKANVAEMEKLSMGPFPAQLAYYVLSMDEFFAQPSTVAESEVAAKSARDATKQAKDTSNGTSNGAPGARNVMERKDGFSRLDFEDEHAKFEVDFFSKWAVERCPRPITQAKLQEAIHRQMDAVDGILFSSYVAVEADCTTTASSARPAENNTW